MCTVVISRLPGQPWPLLIGANRDEMASRPSRPPGRWWDDRPEVIAGLDELAGGSWLGMNDTGVVAAILNRVGTLGPQAGKRSRGELVLEALDNADAADAAQAMADLAAGAYRPFNMVIADNRDAFWIKADGGHVAVRPLAPGLHMLSAQDLDDLGSPRIKAYLEPFTAAVRPEPAPDLPHGGDWNAWTRLLRDTGNPGNESEEAPAMCFTRDSGFGTVSSSLIALPAAELEGGRPLWLYADSRPDRAEYRPVTT